MYCLVKDDFRTLIEKANKGESAQGKELSTFIH